MGEWNEGAMRSAAALLGSNGGFTVLLRLPGQAVSGADAEQLGLSTPLFQEVPVEPAVWRKTGSCAELLLGAQAICGLVGSADFPAAESLFESAVGVIVDGVLYTIATASPLMAGGAPCAYRLTLQAPVWS